MSASPFDPSPTHPIDPPPRIDRILTARQERQMILVKKAGSQESGFTGSKPNQRGPYLLISKAWLAHFPALSTTHENDAALVVLDCMRYGRVVLPFVWHNSKRFHNQPNGRDEYRVYIAGMERAGVPCPEPGDLILLQPFSETNGDGFNDHFRYRVVRQSESIHAELVAAASTDRNYWEISGDLISGLGHMQRSQSDPPDPAANHPTATPEDDLAPNEGIESRDPLGGQRSVSLDSGDVVRFLGRTPAEVLAMRMSSQTFRDVVLASYSSRCAVTGKALKAGEHLNVEAAHIQPRVHHGLNLPSNGIALSRDLHWGFDKGAFTLTNSLRVEVHPELLDTDWREFEGRSLQVPEHDFFRPCPESIEHHRTRVYGRFLHTGTLRRLDED